MTPRNLCLHFSGNRGNSCAGDPSAIPALKVQPGAAGRPSADPARAQRRPRVFREAATMLQGYLDRLHALVRKGQPRWEGPV